MPSACYMSSTCYILSESSSYILSDVYSIAPTNTIYRFSLRVTGIKMLKINLVKCPSIKEEMPLRVQNNISVIFLL